MTWFRTTLRAWWHGLPLSWRMALTVSIPTAILFVIYFWPGIPPILLGLDANLAAVGVGVLVTLLYVDRLLRGAEERRRSPAVRATARVAARYVSELVRLIGQMRKAAMDPAEPFPATVGDLLSVETFIVIRDHLNLEANSPIHPPVPWFQYIHVEAGRIDGGIRASLANFGVFLPPDVFADFSELTHCVFLQITALLPVLYQQMRPSEGLQAGNLIWAPLTVGPPPEIEFPLFNRVVQRLEELAREYGFPVRWISDEELRTDNIAPRKGSSRR